MFAEKPQKKKYQPKSDFMKVQHEEVLTDAQRSELRDIKKNQNHQTFQQEKLIVKEGNQWEGKKPRPYPGFSKIAKKQSQYGEGKTVQREYREAENMNYSDSDSDDEESGNGWRGRRKRGRGRRQDRSDSNSSSSDSESSEREEEQKGRVKCKGKKKQLKERISKGLYEFFMVRKVQPEAQERIVCFLAKRLADPLEYNLNKLLWGIEQLQMQGYTQYLQYLKVIKILVKRGLQPEFAIQKIAEVQQKKMKKIQADREFKQKYGEGAVPLKKDQLKELDLKQTIFLVDGNNILPVEKHLRKFFKSGRELDNVEGQVRLRWYLSNCLPHYNIRLFFDQQYGLNDYLHLMAALLPKEHQGIFTSLPVTYGEGKKADDRIVDTAIAIQKQMPEKKVVLVSADRQLHQRCNQKELIQHTSGKPFFKYLRYLIFRRFEGVKDKKAKEDRKIIRKILKYQ